MMMRFEKRQRERGGEREREKEREQSQTEDQKTESSGAQKHTNISQLTSTTCIMASTSETDTADASSLPQHKQAQIVTSIEGTNKKMPSAAINIRYLPTAPESDDEEINSETAIHQDDSEQDDVKSKEEDLKPKAATTSGKKGPDPKLSPPDWHENFKDATEIESLIFCVRRPTARDKLFKLVNNLKLLSSKLKRHEEVTLHLNGISSPLHEDRKRASDESDDQPKSQSFHLCFFPLIPTP